MNEPTYKVLKLTNGENIICLASNELIDGKYEIELPLKMEVISRPTKNGSVESLNLSRLIGPYTEETIFSIKESHILLIAAASEGLIRYYDHAVKEMEQWNQPEDKKLLEDINEDDVYDQLLKELVVDNKSIH